jgi:hypothetical protein
MSLPAGSLIIYNVAHLAASPHKSSDRAYTVCGRHQPPVTTGASPERRVFLYYVYAKCSSYMKCRRKFRRRFPNAPTFITKTIYNYVKSFRATRSIPDSKRTRRKRVLTKEKLDEIGD